MPRLGKRPARPGRHAAGLRAGAQVGTACPGARYSAALNQAVNQEEGASCSYSDTHTSVVARSPSPGLQAWPSEFGAGTGRVASTRPGRSPPSSPWRTSHFSPVGLWATLWTVARQAPRSMGFSWQECWSGLPWPPPSSPLRGMSFPPTSPTTSGAGDPVLGSDPWIPGLCTSPTLGGALASPPSLSALRAGLCPQPRRDAPTAYLRPEPPSSALASTVHGSFSSSALSPGLAAPLHLCCPPPPASCPPALVPSSDADP